MNKWVVIAALVLACAAVAFATMHPTREAFEAQAFVFCHVPHTSGRALLKAIGTERLPPDPTRNQFLVKHHFPWTYLCDNLDVSTKKTFTISRNPYARLAGCYKHLTTLDKVKLDCSFAEFVEDLYANHYDRIKSGDMSFALKANLPKDVKNSFEKQRLYVMLRTFTAPAWVYTGTREAVKCDRVWKFEDGQQIYGEIADFVGVSRSKVPPPKPQSEKWKKHYTPALARKVAELYEDDFRLFGYDQNFD